MNGMGPALCAPRFLINKSTTIYNILISRSRAIYVLSAALYVLAIKTFNVLGDDIKDDSVRWYRDPCILYIIIIHTYCTVYIMNTHTHTHTNIHALRYYLHCNYFRSASVFCLWSWNYDLLRTDRLFTSVLVGMFWSIAVAVVPEYSVDATAIRKEKTKYCFYRRPSAVGWPKKKLITVW